MVMAPSLTMQRRLDLQINWADSTSYRPITTTTAAWISWCCAGRGNFPCASRSCETTVMELSPMSRKKPVWRRLQLALKPQFGPISITMVSSTCLLVMRMAQASYFEIKAMGPSKTSLGPPAWIKSHLRRELWQRTMTMMDTWISSSPIFMAPTSYITTTTIVPLQKLRREPECSCRIPRVLPVSFLITTTTVSLTYYYTVSFSLLTNLCAAISALPTVRQH